VTLLERGELTSGTTGRHHGLLHSGARYAVNDPESATECIDENAILRRIAPGSFEENDGLFVALDDEDMAFLPTFMSGCEATGVPAERVSPAAALAMEPLLDPALKAAVRVPDATMDAMRLPLRFIASARSNGARVLTHIEVTDVRRSGAVHGVSYRDHVSGRDGSIEADLVVNATGPWAGRIAALAGAVVPIRPSPGVMVALKGRLCNMVVNRLHRSGDGDIVVPQRRLSIVGTTSWVVDDPDDFSVPADHVERMMTLGAKLIPSVRGTEIRAAWSAARPLIGSRDGDDDARELSRTFEAIDHAKADGVEGFVTITGGKATTLRAMAEACAGVVCRKLGVEEPCRTRDTVLLPHTAAVAA
jgi:glycerol-3-phosphate dehydrogenase